MNELHTHALGLVHHYAKNPGVNKWLHVHPHRLAEQLEARITNPNLINQRGSSWCGPAAVCASMARDAPATYVNMIIHLVQHGHANVHHGRLMGHTLKASPELRHCSFHKTGIAEADWVPLATLRESLKSTQPHETAWFFKHGTFPEDVMAFYRDLGYSKLEDHTSEWNMLGGGTLNCGLAVIHSANHLYHSHHRITMRINADMLDGFRQGDNSKLPSQAVRHNHWVDLISPIDVVGAPHGPTSTVYLKVFSWGQAYAVPQNPPLTLREFGSNFFGFIAAKF